MQFKSRALEEDPTKIEAYKSDAVRALSNYMVYKSAQSDKKLQKAMNLNTPGEKKSDKEDDDSR